ncbi:MAG: DDE-type integrase/transposase/recombinase [Chloroflexi bacterium]|nr:DDE-type integrase/transposase/recombinase [Chloroflexota bacterium]
MIDLYSRRIVGWAMNARMTGQLVREAFQMAWRQCQPQAGLLFHSDRGSQYTSHEFQRLLQACQVKASMSGTGNCYDNAVAESFFSALKMELIYQTVYLNREEAMTDIFFYIEGFL